MMFVIVYTYLHEGYDPVDKNYFSSREESEQYLFDNYFTKIFGCEEYKKSIHYAEIIELNAFK